MTDRCSCRGAARNSMEWFENVKRTSASRPEQFAYSLLTRSQRVSHENLRLRDREYLHGVERWFAAGTGGMKAADAPAPMFTPFSLRGMTLVNRVAVAPMDMYSAADGTPSDFHLVHLGARALGGAGLVFTEMTCVSPEARIARVRQTSAPSMCRRGGASSSSCTGTARPASAFSSGTPGRKAR